MPLKPSLGAARINWDHPLTRGLKRYWVMNEAGVSTLELVQRGVYTLTGVTRSVSRRGPALAFSSAYARADTAGFLAGSTLPLDGVTYAGSIYPTVLTGRQTIFAHGDEGLATPMLEIGPGGGGTSGRVVSIRPGTFQAETVDEVLTVDAWNSIAYVRTGSGAGGQFIYVNGVGKALDVDSNATNEEPLLASQYIMGARNTTPTQAFAGRMEWFGIWLRPLSGGEIAVLHIDPYSFLVRSRRRRVAIPTATGRVFVAPNKRGNLTAAMAGRQ